MVENGTTVYKSLNSGLEGPSILTRVVMCMLVVGPERAVGDGDSDSAARTPLHIINVNQTSPCLVEGFFSISEPARLAARYLT